MSSPTRDIEVFRGIRDDQILDSIDSTSIALEQLCDRHRGEEINKAGLLWRCPSCLSPTVPGRKKKGGRYANKDCDVCGLELTSENVSELRLIDEQRPRGSHAPFIDGDDLPARYAELAPSKFIDLDVDGWSYKDAAIYEPPKILIRQAGVGLAASLDRSNARVPQSVYIYRVADRFARAGLSNEFVLGALLSRTMTYVVFKRFAEVDPAKAHAKLTHSRLAKLPSPALDLSLGQHRAAHDEVVKSVKELLGGTAALGSSADMRIELRLRELWGLSSDDGAYIHGEFFDVPGSQAVRALFPDGPPQYRGAHPPQSGAPHAGT